MTGTHCFADDTALKVKPLGKPSFEVLCYAIWGKHPKQPVTSMTLAHLILTNGPIAVAAKTSTAYLQRYPSRLVAA